MLPCHQSLKTGTNPAEMMYGATMVLPIGSFGQKP